MWSVYGERVLDMLGLAADYDTYVGLWLNLDRLQLRSAGAVAQGYAAAKSTDQLDRSWFDALVLEEAQVDELTFRSNFERLKARVRARGGRLGN